MSSVESCFPGFLSSGTDRQISRQTLNRKPDTVPGVDQRDPKCVHGVQCGGVRVQGRWKGGVRTVCLGGDSGFEPAGRKGASPTGYLGEVLC